MTYLPSANARRDCTSLKYSKTKTECDTRSMWGKIEYRALCRIDVVRDTYLFGGHVDAKNIGLLLGKHVVIQRRVDNCTDQMPHSKTLFS